MFYGGVMGSFAVERFGTERLQAVTSEEINERFESVPRDLSPRCRERRVGRVSLRREGGGVCGRSCLRPRLDLRRHGEC